MDEKIEISCRVPLFCASLLPRGCRFQGGEASKECSWATLNNICLSYLHRQDSSQLKDAACSGPDILRSL